ncbi:hypothetical protein RMCBS344292_01505 [Rhizopus microsporus]|nr:hypothetical protein RMCBS344292_01505 [Rhizopus microsporus]
MAILARKVERSNITRIESNVAGGSQLTSENDDDDGIEEEELITGNITDLTRRRLRCLKYVPKNLLLDDRKDTFSIDDLKKECSDVDEKEAYPCLLILNALKPYISKKEERFIIAHQLPFCILANDTLLYAGYKKLYRKLCPQPSASTLHALRVDGPSLYQILTRLPCALAIFNYDNYLIESIEEARQNKDAVFSSLFDMNAITTTCKSNGIKFAQNISLLPGTKDTVSNSSKKGPASHDLINHSSVKKESKKPKETLQQEMQGLQAEVTGEKQLKDALKNEKSRDFSKKINGLKLKWRNSSHEERSCLYNGIEQLRDERNQLFSLVQTTRDDLKLKRQMLHFKRIAMKQ